MPDLERTLRDLAAAVRYPETPDLAALVAAAAPAPPARRRRRRRHVVAVGIALALVAVGIAFAVPPARSAILDWLGFGPVQIQRVETLPSVPLTKKLALGRAVTLAEARREAGFRVLVPPGTPDGVFVRRDEVSLVYGPVLLGELLGRNVFVARKVVGPGTRVEDVTVSGAPGLWIAGAPHQFAYIDPDGAFQKRPVRLVGNVLLWQRGPLVLRLEGATTKAQALRIAASVR